jgi:hypothetical protein
VLIPLAVGSVWSQREAPLPHVIPETEPVPNE